MGFLLTRGCFWEARRVDNEGKKFSRRKRREERGEGGRTRSPAIRQNPSTEGIRTWKEGKAKEEARKDARVSGPAVG